MNKHTPAICILLAVTLAIIAAVAGYLCNEAFQHAKSAVHEIEALILALIATVALGFFGLLVKS